MAFDSAEKRRAGADCCRENVDSLQRGTTSETRHQKAWRIKGEREAREAREARLLAVVRTYIDDLGGDDALSAADKATIQCIATLTVQMQDLEQRFNAGNASSESLSLFNRMSGTLRRLLSTLPKRKHTDTRPPTIEEIEAEYAAADNDDD